MAMRGRSQRHSIDSDIQMMETDIMRFLAIIALCLAIIFALVSQVSHQASTEAQSTESKPNETQPAHQEPAPQVLAQEVSPTEQKQEQVENIDNTQQTPPVAETEPTPPIDVPTDEKEGFQLSFASDDAFSHLVGIKQVSLYYLQSDSAWAWEGQWQPSTTPGRYYPMHVDTVPSKFLHPSNNGEYVVVLPNSIEMSIQSITSAHSSGLLLITRSGEVERNPL